MSAAQNQPTIRVHFCHLCVRLVGIGRITIIARALAASKPTECRSCRSKSARLNLEKRTWQTNEVRTDKRIVLLSRRIIPILGPRPIIFYAYS